MRKTLCIKKKKEKEFCMVKIKLFAMLTIIMLVFALSGCPEDPPPQGTWEQANIEPISGIWSGNTISFTYNDSPCMLTRNGGGNTLDGVWNGTFEGDPVKVTVSGNNWTMEDLDSGKYVEYSKGTVTASGTNLTIIVTHVMDYGESYGSGSSGPVGLGPGGQVSGDTEVITNGRLTITGLEAYNGYDIIAQNNEYGLMFCEKTVKYENGYGGLANNTRRITNGQITQNVFRMENITGGYNYYSDYSGNDQNVSFFVTIFDGPQTLATGSVIVNFTNGIGSGAFVLE
jgi:hypothetical protein